LQNSTTTLRIRIVVVVEFSQIFCFHFLNRVVFMKMVFRHLFVDGFAREIHNCTSVFGTGKATMVEEEMSGSMVVDSDVDVNDDMYVNESEDEEIQTDDGEDTESPEMSVNVTSLGNGVGAEPTHASGTSQEPTSPGSVPTVPADRSEASPTTLPTSKPIEAQSLTKKIEETKSVITDFEDDLVSANQKELKNIQSKLVSKHNTLVIQQEVSL
jgi:hypothetical protein